MASEGRGRVKPNVRSIVDQKPRLVRGTSIIQPRGRVIERRELRRLSPWIHLTADKHKSIVGLNYEVSMASRSIYNGPQWCKASLAIDLQML